MGFGGEDRIGYKQKKDMEDAYDATKSTLDVLKAEFGDDRVNQVEASWQKRQYEDALLETPDTLLEPQNLKDKRRVKSTRGAAEARERIRQQKEEEKQKLAEAEAEAMRRKEEDPKGYLDSKLKQREELVQKIKRRNVSATHPEPKRQKKIIRRGEKMECRSTQNRDRGSKEWGGQYANRSLLQHIPTQSVQWIRQPQPPLKTKHKKILSTTLYTSLYCVWGFVGSERVWIRPKEPSFTEPNASTRTTDHAREQEKRRYVWCR